MHESRYNSLGGGDGELGCAGATQDSEARGGSSTDHGHSVGRSLTGSESRGPGSFCPVPVPKQNPAAAAQHAPASEGRSRSIIQEGNPP